MAYSVQSLIQFARRIKISSQSDRVLERNQAGRPTSISSAFSIDPIQLILLMLAMFASGCSALLPTSQSTAESRWKNYEEIQASFDCIETNHTGLLELACMGFDPRTSPNVKILTYVDVIQRFIPNPAIRKEDLHPAVREFIEAKEQGIAYEIILKHITAKRHGNVFLDVTGFKRQTHESGWEFKGIILINGEVVIYKLSSGDPAISREEEKIRPLGPLQELDNALSRAVGDVW